MYPVLYTPYTPGASSKKYAVCVNTNGNQIPYWTGDSEKEAKTFLATVDHLESAIFTVERYYVGLSNRPVKIA